MENLSMNICSLSDSALLEGLTIRVKTERKSMTEVLEFLREVDRRRLYTESGHASLWEFCTKVHGYSSGAAARRIQAMRLLRDIPELKEDLETGRQNLSSLAQAQQFFRIEEKHQEAKLTTEQKREVLGRIQGKSTRDSEKELLKLSSAPIEISKPEKKRVIDENHTELKLVLDSELLEKLDRIQALRSHANPLMGYKELLEFMADEILKKLEKPVKAKTHSSPAPELIAGKRVAIPEAIKREIKKPGKCGFINEKTGESCDSRYFLEVDHVIPVALGGSNDLKNLRLRCRAHNQRASVKIFGLRRE
jgi:hypothetical protein